VNESNLLVGVDWWAGHDTNLFFRNYYYQGMEKSQLIARFWINSILYEVNIRYFKCGMVKS